MKVALDFDGVFTDLKQGHPSLLDEHELHLYLAKPASIASSVRRPGILQLVSSLSLFGQIEIISARPEEHKPFIHEWLDREGFGPMIDNVICCGDDAKYCILHSGGIDLLVDDSACHLKELLSIDKGILWSSQSWREVLDEAFGIICRRGIGQLRCDSNFVLRQAEYASDMGASPVYILTGIDGSKYKLRVCLNREVYTGIVEFLQITERAQYEHVARIVDTSGVSVLKTFIPGVQLKNLSASNRHQAIIKIGKALARLHAIRLGPEHKLPNIWPERTEEIALLLCGADDFNTIVRGDDEVAFIDLEACACGPKWVDVAWSEHLLCENADERQIFLDSYLSYRNEALPVSEDWSAYKLLFLNWLSLQLGRSQTQHPADERIKESIAHVRQMIFEQQRKSPG